MIGIYHSGNAHVAQISLCGRAFLLGRFADPELAADVYDNAAYYCNLAKQRLAPTMRRSKLNNPAKFADPVSVPGPLPKTFEAIAYLESQIGDASNASPHLTQSDPAFLPALQQWRSELLAVSQQVTTLMFRLDEQIDLLSKPAPDPRVLGWLKDTNQPLDMWKRALPEHPHLWPLSTADTADATSAAAGAAVVSEPLSPISAQSLPAFSN